MDFITVVVIIAIIYVLIKIFNNNDNKKTKNEYSNDDLKKYDTNEIKIEYDKEEVNEEAKKKAEKITTYNQLEKLEEQLYNVEDKMNDYEDDGKIEMYAKAFVKHEILEKAYDIAQDKPFRYYVSDIDVNLPIEIAKKAGKLITLKEYETLKVYDDGYFDYFSLEEADDIEELKKEAARILDYDNNKEIINFLKLEEKNDISKINDLLKKSSFLQEEFDIDLDDELDPYEQYLEYKKAEGYIRELEKKGVPNAYLFVENGYNTIESIKSLSDKEVLAMKGIGKKTLEKLRKVI